MHVKNGSKDLQKHHKSAAELGPPSTLTRRGAVRSQQIGAVRAGPRAGLGRAERKQRADATVLTTKEMTRAGRLDRVIPSLLCRGQCSRFRPGPPRPQRARGGCRSKSATKEMLNPVSSTCMSSLWLHRGSPRRRRCATWTRSRSAR